MLLFDKETVLLMKDSRFRTNLIVIALLKERFYLKYSIYQGARSMSCVLQKF